MLDSDIPIKVTEMLGDLAGIGKERGFNAESGLRLLRNAKLRFNIRAYCQLRGPSTATSLFPTVRDMFAESEERSSLGLAQADERGLF